MGYRSRACAKSVESHPSALNTIPHGPRAKPPCSDKLSSSITARKTPLRSCYTFDPSSQDLRSSRSIVGRWPVIEKARMGVIWGSRPQRRQRSFRINIPPLTEDRRKSLQTCLPSTRRGKRCRCAHFVREGDSTRSKKQEKDGDLSRDQSRAGNREGAERSPDAHGRTRSKHSQ